MATVINGSDNFNTNNVATQTELDAQPSPLGVGQTWQDVTASRASGTTYTNTTGKSICVMANSTYSTSTTFWMFINGTQVYGTNGTSSVGQRNAGFMIVPNGSTYSVTTTIERWWELR